MAHYSGDSLKERLHRSPLTLKETIDVVFQIADGLALAHEQGILHRDIKPANVFLTSRGEVKILDFGLAKFLGGAKLTKTGTSMGTLNYMPPEQLQGKEVGVEADIWALGALTYEMLTGRAAFGGDNDGAVVYNILNRDPEPLEPTGSSIDVGLERLLGRCLDKNQVDRYPSMSELKEDLSALRGRVERFDAEVTQIRSNDDQPTMVLDTGTRNDALAPNASGQRDKTPSVAVLDFTNITSDPAADWLSSGIAESLSVDLGKLASVKVIGRSKVREAMGSMTPTDVDDEKLRDVGKRVRARWLFWGAFQKQGEAIRVTAHCLDVVEGRTLETFKLDGSMDQIFQLQDQIITRLMKSLDLEVSDSEMFEIERPQTRDLEAYEYCAKARQLLYRMAGQDIDEAQKYLEKAIGLDPGYAMAYSTLGQLFSFRFIATTDRSDLTQAIRYLTQATELDSELSDPHAWLTYAYSREGRFEEAIESGRRAVELDADNPQAHYFLAVAHWLRGLIEFKTDGHVEAAQHLKRVIELTPRYQPGSQILSAIYFSRGQYEQAWKHAKNAVEIEESGNWELGRFVGAISLLARMAYRAGDFTEAENLVARSFEVSGEAKHVYAPACNALAYCVQGDLLLKTQRPDEALLAFRSSKEQVASSPRSLGIGWPMLRAHLGLARAFRAVGMKNESDASLRQATALFESKDGYDFSGLWDSGEAEFLVELAVCYCSIHNRDEALNSLERAVDLGWLETPRCELESSFQSLREEPRFQAVQDKLRRQGPIP
jgi:non-specific serine/threonine protein kinase